MIPALMVLTDSFQISFYNQFIFSFLLTPEFVAYVFDNILMVLNLSQQCELCSCAYKAGACYSSIIIAPLSYVQSGSLILIYSYSSWEFGWT